MKAMKGTIDPKTRNTITFNTIEEALDKIDFKAISKAMYKLGWIYCDGNPTAKRLKETVHELYESTMKHWNDCKIDKHGRKISSTESGGFKVTVEQYPDDDPMILINFTISGGILKKDIKD